MKILKDEKLSKANVSNSLGGRTLVGIVYFSYDKIIQFMMIHISMYFTSLEDKDHTSDVIECLYDDVVKDMCVKKEFSLFLKETKMKNEVDIINKKRLLTKKIHHLSAILRFKQQQIQFRNKTIFLI